MGKSLNLFSPVKAIDGLWFHDIPRSRALRNAVVFRRGDTAIVRTENGRLYTNLRGRSGTLVMPHGGDHIELLRCCVGLKIITAEDLAAHEKRNGELQHARHLRWNVPNLVKDLKQLGIAVPQKLQRLAAAEARRKKAAKQKHGHAFAD